ncbi:MAG: hypothetical protein NUV32_05925 [Exilispira sp.]|jgi:hypothetical protein|nr:hypothetical protein [Exilispira sp.]
MAENNEFYDFLVKNTISWIYKNREIYRPIATTLDKKLKERLYPYFNEDIVDNAKVIITNTLPSFDFLKDYGFTEFTNKALNLTYNSGIIFIDTLVISSRSKIEFDSIVFYLLVHSSSYRLIGVESFVSKYVHQSLEENYNLKEILIEKFASSLTTRYEKGESFSVEEELKKFYSN